MENNINISDLTNLNNYISKQFGIYFKDSNIKDLERIILKNYKNFNFSNVTDFIKNLTNNKFSENDLIKLSTILTIGETYFFRDEKAFNTFEKIIIPKLIEKNKHKKSIRIWSAAASSGEEAYSISILLKNNPTLKDWNCEILATDININSLNKAKKAIYTKWSLRNLNDLNINKYFNKLSKNSFQLKDIYKNNVQFEYLNLAKDKYPSILNKTNALDVIFCRNVLMYFNDKTARIIIKKLCKCVVNNGYLIFAPTDSFFIEDNDEFSICENNSMIYKKQKPKNKINKFSYIEEKSNLNNQLKYKTKTSFKNYELSKINLNKTKQNKELKIKFEPKLEEKKEQKFSIFSLENLNEMYKNEKYAEIINYLQPIIDKHKPLKSDEMPSIYFTLSKCYANVGELQLAETYIQNALNYDKVNKIFYYFSGMIYLEMNNMKKAIEELKKSLFIDPDFLIANFSLANIYNSEEKYIDAKKYYKIVLKLLNNTEKKFQLLEEEFGLSIENMEILVKKALESIENIENNHLDGNFNNNFVN